MDNKTEEKMAEEVLHLSRYLPPHLSYGAIGAEDIAGFLKKEENAIDSRPLFKPYFTQSERYFIQAQLLLNRLTNTGGASYAIPLSGLPLRWRLVLQNIRNIGIDIDESLPFFYDFIPNDAPKRYFTRLFARLTEDVTDGELFSHGVAGYGISDDPDIAASKAVGEFLERYLLTLYRRSDLNYMSVRDCLRREPLSFNPIKYDYYTQEQRREHSKGRLSRDSVFGWVKGRELCADADAWLPAQLVYWNYKIHSSKDCMEPLIWEANTNGAGGFFNRTDAILSGLREFIQRDAFLFHWLHRIPPIRIDPDTIHADRTQSLLQSFRRHNLEASFSLLETKTDEPAVLVSIHDTTGKGPRLVVAASCNAHIEDAIYAGLEEALSCYYGQYRTEYQNFSLLSEYRPFADSSFDQEKRLKLACNQDNFTNYKWLFEGAMKSVQDLGKNVNAKRGEQMSSDEQLSLLLKCLEKKGHSVYCFDVKHTILSQLNYYVVQIIVPDLLQLYLREDNITLGHPLLGKVSQINTFPHPFP